MTWQRIDDDTYIDDTLVTCAEYQLFIDETCERGEYYQPDHWTSFQFPRGNAKEPILGIRYSDALAFCEWLTWHEISGWGFRLPTNMEARINVKKQYQQAGYWIGGNFQFAWTGSLFEDTRTPQLSRVRERILARTFSLDADLVLARGAVLNSPLDLTRNCASEIDPHHLLHSAIEGDSLHAIELAKNLETILSRGPELADNRAIEDTLHRSKKLADDLGFILGMGYKNHDFRIGFESILDQCLNIYVDIYVIQERIAGRSSAFEGIRLVKERIR